MIKPSIKHGEIDFVPLFDTLQAFLVDVLLNELVNGPGTGLCHFEAFTIATHFEKFGNHSEISLNINTNNGCSASDVPQDRMCGYDSATALCCFCKLHSPPVLSSGRKSAD